jgi:hypothetical protein
MTDPERFVDRPPSELGALLLRAGAEEGPSQKSLQRTLSALGVGVTALGAASGASALGAAASATGAAGVGAAGTAVGAAGVGAGTAVGAAGAVGAKWAGSLGAAVLAKWASVGAASGIVVALAVHTATDAEHAVPGSAESAASVPVVAGPSAWGTQAPRISSPPEAEPVAPQPSAYVREAKPSRVVAEAEAAPLAAEVAFVDRGRAAYQRGDLPAAERALAGYEREFADPRLLPEVLYLRMEVATQRGEQARAVALAQRILRQHARSPHAARARAVLRSE